MKQIYPDLNDRILNISEGDTEFMAELAAAIHNGMKELKQKYSEGKLEKNESTIQQARHKLKPTLIMFEFNDILEELQEGKEIVEKDGFSQEFDRHYNQLMKKLELAIDRVETLQK